MSLSLAEFEARCMGESSGKIDLADFTQAYNRVDALLALYQKSILKMLRPVSTARQARPPSRPIPNFITFTEASLPKGDRE